MQTSSSVVPSMRLAASRVPSLLRSRRRLMLVAAIVPLTGSLALGWPWLVAAGIAPLLLSAAPCLAMCVLGLCTKDMSGLSCSTTPAQREIQQ
ncbi:hypothetical protein [Microvirga splendida]|uniref:DUF2892 domain-containing protein n=1 Tax=Microvirga splendida TaxID=2795727 RepID=A0ABS0Y616_9HYPH|nr:hypothetical protein [Microvirga splendida]MBJ6127751.1 hypothetical protein [Microvirga splendida]